MYERALCYACGDAVLVGILSLPLAPGSHPAKVGVVIVVGGAQYRAGSHRQFALLARDLAAAGIPVLRFDQRGMGDSEGEAPGFEHLADDLRATIDRFYLEVPGLSGVVLWGLCDGATAAALYAPHDPRVSGLVLLNPWVRTEQGAAQALARHYYRARLFDPALWRKIASGRFAWRSALAALARTVATARRAAPAAQLGATLPERMYGALEAFPGRVLLLLSGADLTAREFDDLGRQPGAWQRLLADTRFDRCELHGADHTLSRRAWHAQAVTATCDWLRLR